MLPETINLLPYERQARLRRDYIYRLVTVSALVCTLVLAVHAALLIPTYRYVEQEITTRSQSLSTLEATLASADEQTLDARLQVLSQETAALGALATSTPESSTLAQLLSISHPGVRITAITLATASARLPAAGSITGVADTRDDLRSYYLAVSGASFITLANLPVSDYASAAQIPFTITLTLP
jgi:hypothetical protein